MTTDIMIVSFLQDVKWLEYCLKSIRKFATGFNHVVLLVPADEKEHFLRFEDSARIHTYERTVDQDKWHIHMQAIKCQADKFCEGDFVLHTDSDCIFTETVKPEDYFVAGRPIMLIEEYARLPHNPWKPAVEHALGFSVRYETMRRHPQVNPRGIYTQLRWHIIGVHGVPFEEFVLSCPSAAKWGFTEHNTIGAFALDRPEWKSKYHWVDVGRERRPKDKLLQFMSRNPLDKINADASGNPLHLSPLEIFKGLGL